MMFRIPATSLQSKARVEQANWLSVVKRVQVLWLNLLVAIELRLPQLSMPPTKEATHLKWQRALEDALESDQWGQVRNAAASRCTKVDSNMR